MRSFSRPPFAAPSLAFVVTAAVAVACSSSVPDRPAQGTGGSTSAGGGAAGNGANGGTASGGSSGALGGAGGEAPFAATRRDLVVSTAACVVEDYAAFATKAAALAAATSSYAAAPEDATRATARTAFVAAMDQWQLVEALAVGPLATADLPGGKDLRDPVHAWPLVSRCGVEQLLVSKGYEAPDYVATSLVNTRGLASLEYLLFYEGTDNECSVAASINSQGTWAAVGNDEMRARKAKLAALLAADVELRAQQLVAAWSEGGGDFAKQLATAGEGSAVYDSLPKAVNAISDALFYLDFQVKDRKLGRPVGLLECEADTCPEKLESRFASRDLANIRQNIVAFRRAMTGCAAGPAGFEDVLVGLGAKDLSDQMLAAIDAALALVDGFPQPTLRDALSNDKAAAVALHAAVKTITDLLKTQFVSVLDLELPKRVEGDND